MKEISKEKTKNENKNIIKKGLLYFNTPMNVF